MKKLFTYIITAILFVNFTLCGSVGIQEVDAKKQLLERDITVDHVKHTVEVKPSKNPSKNHGSSHSSGGERSSNRGGKGKAVAAYAKKFIGNPYKYGGTSLTHGADCSGFTKSIYKKFGIKLPHSSNGQRKYGKKVSLKNAKPGDLVCYSGHVGIYIGGGKIVHASTPKGGIKKASVHIMKIKSIRRLVK